MHRAFFSLLIAVALLGCQHRAGLRVTDDTLYQVSLIDALLAGEYDGFVTVAEVRRHGDFGLGTFDALDGEMIVLDGVVYQARVDGSVAVAEDADTTPFAAVTRFSADTLADLAPAASLDELHRQLDAILSDANRFAAVRIDATITRLTLRSVPEQTPPYRALGEAIADQTTWDHERIAGTLVGLRCPPFAAGLNVPGYHWHFVSDDRTIAGHVLSLELPAAAASIDTLSAWALVLPQLDAVDLTVDRANALEAVEK